MNHPLDEFLDRPVALVHDWLNGMRGGERVLEQFCALFPNADIHTLLFEPENVSEDFLYRNVKESRFARLPSARTHYRHYLPVMPSFAEAFPTRDYDLVISTSHCVAKGAPKPRQGLHLSYIFSPMRYVWDHFEDYLGGAWWKDTGLRAVRGRLQRWDRRTAQNVDAFAADSLHIARKITQFWGRHAVPIHPSVNLEKFKPSGKPPGDYFLVVAALVPYKRIDRAIEAAEEAGVPLVVVGSGPEEERLQENATGDVRFIGRVDDEELTGWYQDARALLYPATEDFGITALESMACGRPVLAFGHGGVTETVIDGVTGRFFNEPSAKSLARLLSEHNDEAYDPGTIRAHAESYSETAFRTRLAEWIRKETRYLV